jgi:enoyl-CoA hydratase
MQAFRSTARIAPQFQSTGLPRLVRGYATQKTFEHLLVSTPKPGVGLSKFLSIFFVRDNV